MSVDIIACKFRDFLAWMHEALDDDTLEPADIPAFLSSVGLHVLLVLGKESPEHFQKILAEIGETTGLTITVNPQEGDSYEH